MTKTLGWTILAVAVLTLLFAGLAYFRVPSLGAAAGTDHYNAEVFLNTVTFKGTQTNDGAITLNAEVSLGANNCASSTSWNPSSVSSTQPAVLDMLMPSGYQVGDLLIPSFATNTQKLLLTAHTTGTAGTYATIELSVAENDAVDTDLGAAAATICYIDVP